MPGVIEQSWVINVNRKILDDKSKISLYVGDKNSHSVGFVFCKDDEPFIPEKLASYFVRRDGKTIMLDGEQDGNHYVAKFSSACYSLPGWHYLFVRCQQDEQNIATVAKIRFFVKEKSEEEEPPCYDPRLDELNDAIDKSNQLVIDIETKLNNGEFDGKDGKDGLSPFIGENGNWWIGETDTGVLAEAQRAEVPVKDVQIDGESIISKGIANIPVAGNSIKGVVDVRNYFGLGVDQYARLHTVMANNDELKDRGSEFKPITASNYDTAVKFAITDGVGPEWTEEEKLAARERIGANVTDVQVVGESIVQNGIANIPLATSLRLGVIKVLNVYGTAVYEDGRLGLSQASSKDILNRSTLYPVVMRNYDAVVKAAMCDGKGPAWSDAEKLASRERTGCEEADEKLDRRLTNLEYALDGYAYRVEDNGGFAYRKDLPIDVMPYASLNKIGGRTLVWNQMVEHGFDEHDYWAVIGPDYVTEDNGVISQTPNGENQIVAASNPHNNFLVFTINHKYCISIYYKTGHAIYPIQIYDGSAWSHTNSSDDNKWHLSMMFITLNDDVTKMPHYLRFSQTIVKENFSTVSIKNPMIFDLTLMFGAGNEPSTPEEFKAMFPEPYYPYSEPRLMNFSSKEVVIQGRNLLDIAGRTEIIYAKKDASKDDDLSHYINDKICFCDYAASGYLTFGTATAISLEEDRVSYGATRLYYGLSFPITNLEPGDYSVKYENIGSNADVWISFYKNGYFQKYYMIDHPFQSVTANDLDSCILLIRPNDANKLKNLWVNNLMLTKGTENQPFSPYKKTVIDISVITQKYFPDGMKSVGDVHDEIDLERGVAVKRVGELVLLGNEIFLNEFTEDYWSHMFVSFKISDSEFKDGKPDVEHHWCCSALGSNASSELPAYYNRANIIIIKGGIFNVFAFGESIAESPSRLIEKIKTLNENGTPFTAYYELDTPIETPITEVFDPTIEIEGGGSITFVNDQGPEYRVPVPNEQTWLVKLPGGDGTSV